MASADEVLAILGGGANQSTSSAPDSGVQYTKDPGARGYPYLQIGESNKGTEGGSYGRVLNILGAPPAAEKTEAPPPRQIGMGEAAGRGLVSGVTANFGDEIMGLEAAGGKQPGQSYDILSGGPLGTMIKGAYRRMTGDTEAEQRYQERVNAEREANTAAAEQHPIANIAGNVGGAIALPGGAMLKAATVPARMLRGAGVGGLYGAAYGAGEGTDTESRLGHAATGAALGGAAGGVAPAILSGASAAVSGLSNRIGAVLGHPLQTLRAWRNPDEEASRRIGTAIVGDINAGGGGMTAAELRSAHASGQPTAVVDVGGEGTRALMRSAANTSPAGRAAVETMTQGRFASQNERIANEIRGPASAFQIQQAIDRVESVANRAAYKSAYKAGDRSINSPELERLMGSPDVVAAMREAAQKGQSRAIAEGHGAFNPGVTVTPDGRVLFAKGKSGVPTYPNIQFWDYTYRALRDSASAAFRAGRNDEGQALSTLSKQMRGELDSLVPEYGRARGIAQTFFGAENALEAGQKFVNMRGSLAEARAAHAKMTPEQKALFAHGFSSDLADKVEKIADNRSVIIDRIFNSPDGRQRIEIALGQGRADKLQMFLRVENMMDLARKGLGNSTTARQWQELALAGGLSGGAEAVLTGNVDLKSVMTGAMVSGLAGGHRAINVKLAQRVGEMLASNDPKVLRTALNIAVNNRPIGTAIRKAENLIERLSGQGGGNAPPLVPAMSVGRADQQQQ